MHSQIPWLTYLSYKRVNLEHKALKPVEQLVIVAFLHTFKGALLTYFIMKVHQRCHFVPWTFHRLFKHTNSCLHCEWRQVFFYHCHPSTFRCRQFYVFMRKIKFVCFAAEFSSTISSALSTIFVSKAGQSWQSVQVPAGCESRCLSRFPVPCHSAVS